MTNTMKLFSPTERRESSLSFHIWISKDEYDYLPPPASTVVFSFELIVDGHIPEFFFELRLSPLASSRTSMPCVLKKEEDANRF